MYNIYFDLLALTWIAKIDTYVFSYIELQKINCWFVSC